MSEHLTTNWRHQAACTDVDPELFFPVGRPGVTPPEQDARTTRAKAVCRGCPVKAECLTWALDHGDDYGVWGGMDPDERRALKQRQARRPGRPRREAA